MYQFSVTSYTVISSPYVRFLADKKFENDVVVRDPCGVVPQIEFFKHLDEKPPGNKKLCKLSIVPTPTQVRYFFLILLNILVDKHT